MNLNPESQSSAVASDIAEQLVGEAAADPAPELFNPVSFICDELKAAGAPDPECWMKHIDPRAETEDDEEARIFFANRSLRLYMAEQEGRNHMEARLLLADGIGVNDWKSIVSKGVVPWILNKLPVNKKQLAAASAAVSDHRVIDAVAVAQQPAVQEDPVVTGDPEAYGAAAETQEEAAVREGSADSLESIQE